jgi:hypothetical protein
MRTESELNSRDSGSQFKRREEAGAVAAGGGEEEALGAARGSVYSSKIARAS